MLCLSLWQPYATLLVAGVKRVETRGWEVKHRGPLLIHAGKTWNPRLRYLCKREPFKAALMGLGVMWSDLERPALPFGCVVGRVDVAACYPTERVFLSEDREPFEDGESVSINATEAAWGDYTPGRFAAVCSNPVLFEKPIPFRGAQGFFDVPNELLAGAGSPIAAADESDLFTGLMDPTDTIGDDGGLDRGGCLDVLPSLADASAQCCITSPPYWGGLRDYGTPEQMGMERDPAAFVDALSRVMLEVRRVLVPTGTLWLNLGDTFAASGKGGGVSAGKRESWRSIRERKGFRMPPPGYKMKDLTLAPFQVADRLRRDGWYLRQTVVWSKPTATEPKRLDRPSCSHEYLFLFAVSEHYDARDPGEHWWGSSVWHINPTNDTGHPAVMPGELVRRCLVSSSKEGDTIIDPFLGSGTVARVAMREGRRAVGIELSPTHYATALARLRHATDRGPNQLFSDLFTGVC